MHMKEIKPSANYSKDACRSRFEALENGTATIPPELDDDPEKRAILREIAKKRAEKNVAKRRAERAEELENVRALNGPSKKITAAVKETPAASSKEDNTRPVRKSLSPHCVVDGSDKANGLNFLDDTFEASSASSGDEVSIPGKPTSLLSLELSTRDCSGSFATQSKEVSTLQANPESLPSLAAKIKILDPEWDTPQIKAALISSKPQTGRHQRHSTQQENTSLTGSEGKAVVQGAERFQQVPTHQECAKSLKSSGGQIKSRNTSELLSVSESTRQRSGHY